MPARWLRGYRAAWLSRDLLAGVTLAAYAIPVSLAYATLAGMPPERGIYGYLLGGLFYSLFGTSRQLAVGPTSAISLLVGVTIAGLAAGDPVRGAEIAALTALVVGIMSAVAWLLHLSTLVSFISETILLGFKAGAALSIALTQLPKLFGVKGGGDHFVERVFILAGQLGETNLVVLTFGLAIIALLLAGERTLPGRPVALVAVVGSIVVMSISNLGERGVTVVGALPQGLPDLGLPAIRLRDVDGVIPLAFACFLLSYIESVSAARAIAARHGYDIDARQELLGLSAANVGVALGQGYPVAGGLSQSVVNDKAGARTPLALIVASATLAVCLLFLTGLLRNLPNVVLAAIVLVAVKGLVDVRGIRHLSTVSRLEFWVSMAALAGVLLLGILKGVLLAALVSILLLLARVTRPQVAFLGRVPGTRHWSDLERDPDNEEAAGVLVFRVEGSLLYFNAEYVGDVVRERLQSMAAPPRLVICDLSATPFVDLAGARMLAHLQRDLHERGGRLKCAEARGIVRDLLVAAGLGDSVDTLDRRVSIDAIVDAFHDGSAAAPAGR